MMSTEEDCTSSPETVEILNQSLLKNMNPVQTVADMDPAKLREYMEGQYAFLQQHYEGLKSQLDGVAKKVNDAQDGLIQRIERILLQMTHHMTIIRQTIDIVASYGDKLTEHERALSKREAEYVSLVERQNRFAISLAKLEKSSIEIVDELERVRQSEESHSNLEWKIATVFGIGAAIVAWLLTGDHFVQILRAIGQVTVHPEITNAVP